MPTALRIYSTPTEYLDSERKADHRGQYVNGVVFAMAGAGDMRLHVPATGPYTSPDLFEVLSEATESFDRGKKFTHYQSIASLSDYVLVAQDQHRVERYRKQLHGDWLLSVYPALRDSMSFPDLAMDLPLSEIYYLVTFP